ncbi:hypothetical protein NEOKW01_0809 [Nematocida sp. AWRm80]|nr:hypothetical protein NEOKW01_0809 [Nematocida sp. AWRm80]
MAQGTDAKFAGMEIDMIESQLIRSKHIVVREEGSDIKLIEIDDITRSKTGKHGSAKLGFKGQNLSTKKNATFSEPSKTLLMICNFIKNPCILIEIDQKKNELVAFNEETLENVSVPLTRIPEDQLEKLVATHTVSPDAEIKFILIDTPYLVSISNIIINQN